VRTTLHEFLVALWMAGMKFHHVVPVVLVIWYLMRPPLPHLDTHAVHTHTASPLSRWVIVKGFPARKECEARRRGNPWDLCVASDDPRLNEK